MPKFLYELTHTNPLPPNGGASLGNELVVYLSVIIVTITLTSNMLELMGTLDVVVGGGGGSTKPPVGMLPAKIEVDNAHMSANAIANCFMM